MEFLIMFLMACSQLSKNQICPIVNDIIVRTSNMSLSSIFLATCTVLLQEENRIFPFHLDTRSVKIVAMSREEFLVWF